MQQEDNIVFLHDYAAARIATMVERKFDKKLSPKIDKESMINFFQALRRVLWYYSNDEEFTVVGIEFLFGKDGSFKISLVCNDKNQIEIKNDYLKPVVLKMFSGKLIKTGKLFIHWNEIIKFEEDMYNDKKGKD